MIIAFAIVTIAISCTEQRYVQRCQTLTSTGVTYWLEPCFINETITEGGVDKEFTVTIKQNSSTYSAYGFSVYGYGVGFPTYGMLSMPASGGASDDQILKMHFSTKCFVADCKNPKVYKGYLPIKVFVRETGLDSILRLPITLVVNPRK